MRRQGHSVWRDEPPGDAPGVLTLLDFMRRSADVVDAADAASVAQALDSFMQELFSATRLFSFVDEAVVDTLEEMLLGLNALAMRQLRGGRHRSSGALPRAACVTSTRQGTTRRPATLQHIAHSTSCSCSGACVQGASRGTCHGQAAFFVSGHERLEVIEAHGTGRLLLTATDVHGAVIVDGGVVYDSAAPLLV